MNRNIVIAVAVVFAVTSIALGYQLYRERQNADRVEIRLDDHGLSIEHK